MNSNEDKQRFYIIYQITNLLDNRIYVGAHSTFNINDKYMGSSKYLKKDMKELGKDNFKKEILHVFDNKKDMMAKETEIVNKEFCHRIDTYNKIEGGKECWNSTDMITVKNPEGGFMNVYNNDPRWLSGELQARSKNKITVKDKNGNCFQLEKDDIRWINKEVDQITKGNKFWEGKKHTEKTKEIMSNNTKKYWEEKEEKTHNYHHTDEAKQKLSDYNKGRKLSEETKEKLRQINLGKKQSIETINKRINTRNKNKIIRLFHPEQNG